MKIYYYISENHYRNVHKLITIVPMIKYYRMLIIEIILLKVIILLPIMVNTLTQDVM